MAGSNWDFLKSGKLSRYQCFRKLVHELPTNQRIGLNPDRESIEINFFVPSITNMTAMGSDYA